MENKDKQFSGIIEAINPAGLTTFVKIGVEDFSDFRGHLSKNFKLGDNVEGTYTEKQGTDKVFKNMKTMMLKIAEDNNTAEPTSTAQKPEGLTHTEKVELTTVIVGLTACLKIVAANSNDQLSIDDLISNAIELRAIIKVKACEIVKEEQ